MCAGSSVVVVYVLHTAVGGDDLQNWEKRLLFCSSYSVLPFFVEASHIYPEEGEILWDKYLMQRGFDISLNVFVCHVQVGRYSLFIHNLKKT